MRICQVVTGLIPVLERGKRGWGAVEKIISEYSEHLRQLGHEVDVKYLNEINAEQNYDIVHVHMANLAVECGKRGIPYIYSLHDHHVEHYGYDGYPFNVNLQAIKGSVFSITHAEYYIDYFHQTDKLFYLSHGVNTDYFTPSVTNQEKRLLMVANNGLAGDSSFDRKGFRYGIEAAKQLDMPITIVGTGDNKAFFDAHKDLLEYDKLNLVLRNPTEEELRDIYCSHDIFLHPSMLEAGHPNLTLLEAASCCLPMVATYRGSKKIEGLHLLEEISSDKVKEGIQSLLSDYDSTKERMKVVRAQYDWGLVCAQMSKMYAASLENKHYDSKTISEKYQNCYDTI